MTKTMKPKPRKHTPAQKVAILREHLLDQRPVSEICRAHQLHPNVFYRWQKEFFEGGAAAFEKESSSQVNRLRCQIDALEGQLATKNEVLAEVMEAYVRLKKNAGVL
ncbi:MAG: transposase [Acidiferrobacterales bacterium]|nr:transposase [Acidiferrobacterales bacterium]